MSDSLKVEIEELEHWLLGPEESEVDIRHLAMNAKGKMRRKLLSYFQWVGSKC